LSNILKQNMRKYNNLQRLIKYKNEMRIKLRIKMKLKLSYEGEFINMEF